MLRVGSRYTEPGRTMVIVGLTPVTVTYVEAYDGHKATYQRMTSRFGWEAAEAAGEITCTHVGTGSTGEEEASMAGKTKTAAKAEQKAVRAAARRGFISKAAARTAIAAAVKPKAAPIIVAKTPDEAVWAAFKKVHGACERCHGTDPFCPTLGVTVGKDKNGNTVKHYDPNFGGGDRRRAIEAARDLARRRTERVLMTAEVKERLRNVAAARRAAAPPKAEPVDLLVKVGKETAGPFRVKIQSLAKEPIRVSELVEKATAAAVPTAAWKVNDMLKLGQLVRL